MIVGGKSGPHARPTMRTDWVRSIRDQCEETSTPFLFKQWGEWAEWTTLASGFKNCSRFDRLGNVAQARARLHPPYRNGFVMPEGDVPWRGELCASARSSPAACSTTRARRILEDGGMSQPMKSQNGAPILDRYQWEIRDGSHPQTDR